MADITAEQCVFIDESAVNERTGIRKRAWAPIGVRAPIQKVPVRVNERFSVLPAYTVNGFLPFALITQGSIKAVEFYEWLATCLLPQLTPHYHVLIMDNNKTHMNQRIDEICNRFGIHVRRLPPYSPDYNPIELAFGVLKAWIRRHWAVLAPFYGADEGSGDGLGRLLKHALYQSGADRHAKKHFKHCGYIFQEERDLIIQAIHGTEGDFEGDTEEDAEEEDAEEDAED